MNPPDINSVMRRLEEEVLTRKRLQEEEASSTILKYVLGGAVGLVVGVGCVNAAPAIASASLEKTVRRTAAATAGAALVGAIGGRGR